MFQVMYNNRSFLILRTPSKHLGFRIERTNFLSTYISGFNSRNEVAIAKMSCV